MAEADHGPRIGADPEMFIQQIADNKIIPVCGKVGGTKERPWIVNDLVDAVYGPEREARFRNRLLEEVPKADRRGDYAVQEDNVMLEFNIPAYKSSDNFSNAIGKILNVIDTNILGAKNYKSLVQVMHTFSAEDIATNPQSMAIGCMPDLDAYVAGTNKERIPFNAAHFGNHRFCGGHIHLQYNHNRVPRHVMAQYMDLFVGLPFLKYDKQRMRRMFYGQPGIYREKPYGIEYRTPSNFWLDKKFRDTGNAGLMAENVLSLGRHANISTIHLNESYTKIDWGEVQHAIKTENHQLAEELVVFARDTLGLPVSMAYR
jgi:Phage phiEco32-like COOH.NH2 ligase-type 2